MAIQSFFRQRKSKEFEHKPIYFDTRKEELDKRVERIRAELIRSGEIEGELSEGQETAAEADDAEFNLGFSERVRGSFQMGTEHIRRQHDDGITAEERTRRTTRLLLILLLMGFVLWYFVFR